MPKLPCHIRTHLEKWDREKWDWNQRIRESYKKSLSGRHKLEELNKILLPVAKVDEEQDSIVQDSPAMPNNQQQNQPKQTNPTTTTPTSKSDRVIHGHKPCIPQQSSVPQFPAPQAGVMFAPISDPPALPISYASSKSITPCSLARIVNSFIGEPPNTSFLNGSHKRKRKTRSDKGVKKVCTPRSRRCITCLKHEGDDGPHIYICNGKTGRGTCEYYDSNGNKLK